MGKAIVIITAANVASAPTFIPGSEPKRNHTLVTVMTNEKSSDGKTNYDNAYPLTFWGPLASVAANFLCVGKQVNIHGELISYRKELPQVGTNGEKKIVNEITVRVTRLELLADPMSLQEKTMQESIAGLIIAGRWPKGLQLTYEDLFPKKQAMIDYNPIIHNVTGKYGVAKIYMKNGATGAGAVAATGAVTDPAQLLASFAAMMANPQNAELMKQIQTGATNISAGEEAAEASDVAVNFEEAGM